MRRSRWSIVLAVSVPAGEALASLLGSNLFSTRNLAASWPAFALCLAALVSGAAGGSGCVARRRWRSPPSRSAR